MATTTSVITGTNSAGTAIGAPGKWAASDNNSNFPGIEAVGDITMVFGNLSVPDGAIINGLTITVEGAGSNFATSPRIFVNNGTSDSSSEPADSAFAKSDDIKTYGSASNLWGLSWTAATANSVVATIDTSTISSGEVYFDHVFMTIDYTPSYSLSLKLTSGKLRLTSGKLRLI